VALSALTGYVLFENRIDLQGLLLTLGILFMSGSSGAINHWQEREIDSLMPRTKTRPIPSGRISGGGALFIASVFVVLGSVILYVSNPPVVILLAWLTLFFYNLIYTPLKKVSAFAVIAGSLVGALPPLIGWSGAGGPIHSELILLVSVFFFIGQIPHFWLLMLLYGNEYKMANLPCINQLLSDSQIKRVTFSWVLTTIASALLLIFFVIQTVFVQILLMAYIFYLVVSLSLKVFLSEEFKVRPAFIRLNFLYLFMMLFLIVDSLIRS